MISFSFFSAMIVTALCVTCLAPVILIALLIRDFRKGEIW